MLAAMVLGMFAFGFALVPIYNSLCQSLGINGKTNKQAIAYNASMEKIVPDRTIMVEFVATNNSGVPWAFYPKTRKLAVEGHTDERGGREYNLALGQKRAEAVRRALGLLGVTAPAQYGA